MLLPTLKTPLNPAQREAFAELPRSGRAVLAYGTGLGKTYAALAAYARVRERHPHARLIVVAESSAVPAWQKDLGLRTTFSYQVLHTAPVEEVEATSKDAAIVVPTCAFRHVDTLNALFAGPPVVLVVDEAHNYKVAKTLSTRIVAYMAAHSHYVWGLTATPLSNNLDDLFGVVDLVRPGYLGSRWQFLDRFAVREERYATRNGKETKYYETVGRKNTEELVRLLRGVIYFRAVDYPLEFIPRQCKLTPAESKLYVQAARGLLRDSDDDFVQFSARLPDLQAVVDNAVNPGPELASKEKLLVEAVEECLARDEAVLVYSHAIPTLDRLKRVLGERFRERRMHVIQGGSTTTLRRKVSQTLSLGDIVLLSSSGSVSLNLQVANNVIVYSASFSASTLIQLIGRIARADSKHSVMRVYLLEAKGTIDTYKRAFIARCEQDIRALVGGSPLPSDEFDSISRSQVARLKRSLLWRFRS